MKKTVAAVRNYWAMIIEGGFYYVGWMMFDVYVVIPVFVDALTGDLRLAGLAATLRTCFSIIPQLLMGHLTPRIKNVPRMLGITGLSGRLLFFLAPLILLSDVSPYFKVFAVYFFVIVCAFCDGTTHVPWLDLLGRTVPAERRGRLLGYQQLLGGIGGILGGYLIKRVLAMKLQSVSVNYSILYFIGACFLTVSGLLLFLLRDNRDRAPAKAQHSLFEYFAGLPEYIRNNKRFVTLMVTQCLFTFNGLASPLYILFAKSRYSLDEGSITTLMYCQLIGSLAGGVIWGMLSHKKGNKFTIQAGIIMNMAVAALAAYMSMFDTRLYFALSVTVIFFSGILLGAWLGFTNALFDVVKEKDQPVYIAISSTLLFPLSFVTFLGGVLADLMGFSGVFIIVIAFMLFALLVSTRLRIGENDA